MKSAVSLIFLFYVSIILSTAQTYIPMSLDGVEGDYLDFITIKDQNYLVTSFGVYLIQGSTSRFIDGPTGCNMGLPIDNYTTSDRVFSFPTDCGHMYRIDLDLVSEMDDSIPFNGALLNQNEGIWKIGKDLQHRKERDQNWHKMALPFEPMYTDWHLIPEGIMLATKNYGVVHVHQPKGTMDYKVKVLNKARGLASDEVTALNVVDSHNFVAGHVAGITIVKNGSYSHRSLAGHTEEEVIEIEVDASGHPWCLTENEIIHVMEDRIKSFKLPLQQDEAFRSIQIADDGNINVTTKAKLFVLPESELGVYEIDNPSGKTIKLYEVRGNHYYTDGTSVYGYEAQPDVWEVHPKKKAPASVIIDSDNSVNLVFENGSFWSMNKNSARTLAKVEVPAGEAVMNLNRINGKRYCSTSANLYEMIGKDFKLLSEEKDSFYKVIEAHDEIYAFGKSGVYRMENDKLTPLLAAFHNNDFPFSTNQFVLDEYLVTFYKESMCLISLKDESIQKVNLAPLEIHDILLHDGQVMVLGEKSVLELDKRALLGGKTEINSILPIFDNIQDGRLYLQSDNTIWIEDTNKLIRLDMTHRHKTQLPNLDLASIKTVEGDELKKSSDGNFLVKSAMLPLEVTYVCSNLWTENNIFSYHINHDGENSSEWKRDNKVSFEPNGNGKHTLIAKVKDDIYGVNLYAEPVVFTINDLALQGSTSSSRSILTLPGILISLLFMWLIVRFASRLLSSR